MVKRESAEFARYAPDAGYGRIYTIITTLPGRNHHERQGTNPKTRGLDYLQSPDNRNPVAIAPQKRWFGEKIQGVERPDMGPLYLRKKQRFRTLEH
jgi:hypothetical protein